MKQTSPRLQKLKDSLKEKHLDGFLVTSAANRFYLTGWYGDDESGFVLVTLKNSYVITDSRYTEHAAKAVLGYGVVETTKSLEDTLLEICEKENLKSLGFESHDLSVFSFKKLKKFLKHTRLVPVEHLVEEFRAVKDRFEIEKLKRAALFGDKAFRHILNFIKPGLSEVQVSWELTNFMKGLGAQGDAWRPLIVAAGANSSTPHYIPSQAKIKKGEVVLLDFGANVEGYVSDMTRVVFVGKPDSEKKRIYNAVLESQKIGIEMVKHGRKAEAIDKKVKNFLERISPQYYRHGLGHGIGIQVHEKPHVSSLSTGSLTAGNVITIEPGIYIPGWGGVRIEDEVLVTKTGYEPLTHSPKEIKDVIV